MGSPHKDTLRIQMKQNNYFIFATINLNTERWTLYQAYHLNNKIIEWYRIIPNFKNTQVSDWINKNESDPTNLDSGVSCLEYNDGLMCFKRSELF